VRHSVRWLQAALDGKSATAVCTDSNVAAEQRPEADAELLQPVTSGATKASGAATYSIAVQLLVIAL
jgi:hypothetical protein